MYESARKFYKIKLSGKYQFLRIDNEDKGCYESKINWKKTNLHHRMYESSRKSYIIMLSLENFWTFITNSEDKIR